MIGDQRLFQLPPVCRRNNKYVNGEDAVGLIKIVWSCSLSALDVYLVTRFLSRRVVYLIAGTASDLFK